MEHAAASFLNIQIQCEVRFVLYCAFYKDTAQEEIDTSIKTDMLNVKMLYYIK